MFSAEWHIHSRAKKKSVWKIERGKAGSLGFAYEFSHSTFYFGIIGTISILNQQVRNPLKKTQKMNEEVRRQKSNNSVLNKEYKSVDDVKNKISDMRRHRTNNEQPEK